jgi:diacylglycerol kinase family enzyme
MTRRPILLLVNPVAGGKPASGPPLADDPARLEPDALAQALRDRGLDVELHTLRETDDPGELAREAAAEGCDVVVAGGDGTVATVAAALVGGDGALGILPRGSFNNLATGYGLPLSLDPALDVIAAGAVSRVDAGWAYHEDPAEGRLFFEAGGVGLDALGFLAVEVAERRGWWRAVRLLWRGLRRRKTPMEVTLDGDARRTRSPAVTVCNGPYLGMGFAVAADADPTDGIFNVALFSGMTQLEVVRHFLSVARRQRRPEPGVQVRLASSVKVKGLRRALPAHADGEAIGLTPVTFEVRPGALGVFRRADSGVSPVGRCGREARGRSDRSCRRRSR